MSPEKIEKVIFPRNISLDEYALMAEDSYFREVIDDAVDRGVLDPVDLKKAFFNHLEETIQQQT